MQMDKQTFVKREKTYNIQAEAMALIKHRSQIANDAVEKVMNRKRAILSTSMQTFLDVYRRIIKIDFRQSEIIAVSERLLPDELVKIKAIKPDTLNPLPEPGSWLKKGFELDKIGHIVVFRTSITDWLDSLDNQSEKELAYAKINLKAAEVLKEQAETNAAVLDAIAKVAEKMSALLTKLNALFVRSMQYTTEIIDNNGYSRNNYSENDRKALMTCINLASAIKSIIDAPVLSSDGSIAAESVKAVETGNQYIDILNEI